MVPGFDTSPAADSAERLIDRLPDDIEDSARHLLRAAERRSLSLCAAESCTGGLIATLLTDIEGQSHSFERGFVVYSNDAKAEMLGVSRATLAIHGAVSKAVALAMAEGALARSRADVALAVTGFAGRGGPGEEPGLVYFAAFAAAANRSTGRSISAAAAGRACGSARSGWGWRCWPRRFPVDD